MAPPRSSEHSLKLVNSSSLLLSHQESCHKRACFCSWISIYFSPEIEVFFAVRCFTPLMNVVQFLVKRSRGFVICMGQRASSTRASPRLTYHLRICVDASDSGLPDRRLVCSQTLPSFHQRRSIIHVGPACQQMAGWSVFILALHCLLMFIFNYKQEDNNGRIIKKEKKENIWTVSATALSI